MAIERAVIVLADIGGYTRFMARQKQSLAHAEATITELLDSVIEAAEHPLILNKLEGDAVLFYASATDANLPQVAKSALHQVNGFFEAFERRKEEMIQTVICDCGGCEQIPGLTIKAVLHCGEINRRKFRKVEELSGMPVITAHRLMKNSVPVKEYLLVTDEFNRMAGGMPGQSGTPLVEDCEGVGPVKVVYYTPDRSAQRPPVETNLWRKMKIIANVMRFLALRKLGFMKERKFHNLEKLGIGTGQIPQPDR
jgi:uncharacterized protein DUF2652